VGILGTLIVVIGLVLVPFPGPGWLIVIVGLLILASEFAWAQRLLDVVRSRVRSWPVRLLVALATAAFVGAVLYVMALLTTIPGWVPGWLVPPLPGLEQFSTWD
jgi:Putative transmembrane protein (PGPGW)